MKNIDNFEAVIQSVAYRSTWRTLRKDLGLHSYKIQLVQEMKPPKHHLRYGFGDLLFKQLVTDLLFHRTVIFIDEAHFWLNGYVNNQNCKIWKEKNPHDYEKTQLHPEKVTVRCAIHVGGIVGQYLLENAQGQRVTVNLVIWRCVDPPCEVL